MFNLALVLFLLSLLLFLLSLPAFNLTLRCSLALLLVVLPARY
jgi:hypothetical protein